MNKERLSHFSLVLETPPADPADAEQHFRKKLSYETDPSDVKLDLQRGQESFILVDARSAEDYAEAHIPGAINIPHRSIHPETVSSLSKNKVIITYCWGPACNASTKAAAKFAALGFSVKEMIGGIEYWRKEGFEVETSRAPASTTP
jgi:rhodanese-related sulfurtransferase